jgi:NAD(P)-dependent dehydrogenase (short-subunit alcohol dehydrogenase family)
MRAVYESRSLAHKGRKSQPKRSRSSFAQLALCDRDAENLAATARAVEATGRRVLTDVFDVRDGLRVQAFLAAVAQTFERVDVLVNNAGGGFFAPFLDLTPSGQEALVRENFGSVANCVRAAVPSMPASGGSIINLTSIEAHRAAPGYATYAAMKAAVASLTRSLALELGERRIRVNCIAPDLIPTPGIGAMRANTPLPVKGRVEDVAGAGWRAAASSRSWKRGVERAGPCPGLRPRRGSGLRGGPVPA